MIPEFGHFALCCLLALTLFSCFAFSHSQASTVSVFRRSIPLQTLCALFAFLSLMFAFLNDDLSVMYVANHAHAALPWYYKATAVWGGHEGSMLLWLLILSGWQMYLLFTKVTWQTKEPALRLGCFIQGALCLFILATSNPFLRFLPDMPKAGADLNPFLQDPAFVIHPPLLYLGYVGLCVPFCLAIGGLISQQWEEGLFRAMRQATLFAWSFLTLGITLGSWWAYYELGWGGWWAWDPVENASLMPWLAATALLHTLRGTQKQGLFLPWTVFLALLGFSLSLLGTFLVRSDVISSVHAFATDPTRGIYMLCFMGVLFLGVTLLYLWRCPPVPSKFKLFSIEAMLFIQSLLVILACACVLLGTLYPILTDALFEKKLSVGAPYFNFMFVPLTLMIMFFLMFGPWLRWGGQKGLSLPKVRLFKGGALIAVYLVFYALTPFGWAQALGLMMGSAVCWITLIKLYQQNTAQRLNSLGGAMIWAHLGMSLVVMGISLLTTFEIEQDVALNQGARIEVGDYQFEYVHHKEVKSGNYEGIQLQMAVYQGDNLIARLYPEKRYYMFQDMVLSETAIEPGFFKDIYVALGEPLESGWTMRLYIKPFIRWIWLGGFMMAAAGLISAFKMRKKHPVHSTFKRSVPISNRRVVS